MKLSSLLLFQGLNICILLPPATIQWLYWNGFDVSLSFRWIICLSDHKRHLEWFYYQLFSVLSYCANPNKVAPQLAFSFFEFCFCTLKKKSKNNTAILFHRTEGLGVLYFSFGHLTGKKISYVVFEIWDFVCCFPRGEINHSFQFWCLYISV